MSSITSLQNELNELITIRSEKNRELSIALRDGQTATAENRRRSLDTYDSLIAAKREEIERFKRHIQTQHGGGGLDAFNRNRR